MYDMDTTCWFEHVTDCASASDEYVAAPDGVLVEVAVPHEDSTCC